MPNQLLIPFDQAQDYPSSLVGEHGKMIGSLQEARLPTHPGFIITAAAFDQFLTQQLTHQLNAAIDLIDPQDDDSSHQALQQFQRSITKAQLPDELARHLHSAYHQLGKNAIYRLSASFHHYVVPPITLYAQGDTNLLIDIKKCWAQLWSREVLINLVQNRQTVEDMNPVLLVEKFSQPKTAGRLSTQNPHNGNKRTMLIEAVWGIGKYLDDHLSEADVYEIDRHSWEVLSTDQNLQKKELVFVKQAVEKQGVPKSRKNSVKLHDNQLLKLAHLGKKVQEAFFFPQEIRWEMDNDNQIVITRIEPLRESALSQSLPPTARPLVYGVGIGDQPVAGTARVFTKFDKSAADALEPTDILVVKHLTPAQIKSLPPIAGLLCDNAVLSKDVEKLTIPCLTSAQYASSIIHDRQTVSLVPKYGVVIDGVINSGELTQQEMNLPISQLQFWYQPDRPLKISPRVIVQSKGLGPIAGKHILDQLNVHPQILKERHKLDLLSEAIYQTLETLLTTNEGKPVIYELIDMTSHEYRRLSGGKDYEPLERNPLLGYRGTYRLLTDKDLLVSQLHVLKELADRFPEQLQLLIPFVRTTEEWILITKVFKQHKLELPLWAGIHTPSMALNFHHLDAHQLHGGVIHEQDFFSLFSGSDLRQHHDLSPSLETDDGYFRLIHTLTDTANKLHKPLLYAHHNGSLTTLNRIRKNGLAMITLNAEQFERMESQK